MSQEMKWMPGFNSWFVVRGEYTSLLVGRSVLSIRMHVGDNQNYKTTNFSL